MNGSTRTAASDRRRGSARPGARLTLRKGTVIDGPFAETKEQLLGFYVLDCNNQDAAVAAARELQNVNPGAVYEIREIRRYIPGAALPEADFSFAHDLRANAKRLSRGKTAAHFALTRPFGSGSCAHAASRGLTSLRTTSPKKASSQKDVA